jgi:hypothetical protein
LLGVICFAISSVAENEKRNGRQWPHNERYPKPNPARSSTLPSHLCGKGYRCKKNDENENRPHVHLTVSDLPSLTITRNRRPNDGPRQTVRPPQLAGSSFSPILHEAYRELHARHTNWPADPPIGARLKHVLQRFSHKGARPGPRLQAGHRLGQWNVGL